MLYQATHERQNNGNGLAHKAAVLGVAALALIGLREAYQFAEDNLDILPELPEWLNDFNPGQFANHPPEVDATVRNETTTVEARYLIDCHAGLSVGVETHGNKDELMGGGEMDKIWFLDYDMCGDKGRAYADVKKVTNKSTGETELFVETDGLQVHRPRVDMLDFRNCVDLRTGDTAEEIEEKITEWQKDEEKGEEKCDNGHDISGWFVVGGDASKVITTAQASAQLATYLDADPGKVLTELNQEFYEELRYQLLARNLDVKLENIHITLTSTRQQTENRLASVVHELQDNYYDFEIQDEEGEQVINVTAPGGGEITANIRSRDISGVDISEISSVLENKTDTADDLRAEQAMGRE